MTPLPIVAAPLQPGQLETCPRCSLPLAQQFVRAEEHESLGKVHVYRCQACKKEVDYLLALPSHAV
ncbi:MAG: hypothetical protein IAF94_07250 [Pirellulaceae bacterium]|nr:hypothetical protein [Pirellulaceae bacterium]